LKSDVFIAVYFIVAIGLFSREALAGLTFQPIVPLTPVGDENLEILGIFTEDHSAVSGELIIEETALFADSLQELVEQIWKNGLLRDEAKKLSLRSELRPLLHRNTLLTVNLPFLLVEDALTGTIRHTSRSESIRFHQ
jgi:hypothetical protein